MPKHFFLLILFSLFINMKAESQIEPPNLDCVLNDTLFWTPAVNSCGPFEAYEIYFGYNSQGPFTLLARIANSSQISFYHANPLNEERYYYMLSDHNCPGEVQLSSDTLNNLFPEVTIFKSVSVIGSDVVLTWEASPSPEVIAYIIYRNTNIGTIPIDTVYNQVTYLDPNANPENESETYYILAVDLCNNTSAFNDPHNTIHLSYSVQECEQEIELEWTPYQNWPNGIEIQYIWKGEDGNTPSIVDSVAGNAVSYTFENASDKVNYCFYISAKEANTGNLANSNEICLLPDLVQPMRNLVIQNVTINELNQIEIEWCWDTIAELKEANLLGMQNGLDVISVENLPLSNPLLAENQTIFTNGTVNDSIWSFYIETIDDCDTSFNSPIASTILLQGQAQPDRNNLLKWSPLNIPGSQIIEYDIFRIEGTNNRLIGSVDPDTNVFLDVPSSDVDQDFVRCYYVVARSVFTKPDGTKKNIASRSNQICIEQEITFFMPNAFAPLGRNQSFKPVGIFGTNLDFQMLIFNRWGGKIFETSDVERGWNGKVNGNYAPPGIYNYLIKIQSTQGTAIEKAGWVMLLR